MSFKDYIEKNYNIEISLRPIEEAITMLYLGITSKRFIFSCGNGGSGYTASHIAQDLSKMCRAKAFSLNSNSGLISAIANDVSYGCVFVNQLERIDNSYILIAISCSGDSPNVINAVNYAKSKHNLIISFTGGDGGKLAKISDININVPTPDIMVAEGAHSIISHYMIREIKEKL